MISYLVPKGITAPPSHPFLYEPIKCNARSNFLICFSLIVGHIKVTSFDFSYTVVDTCNYLDVDKGGQGGHSNIHW